VNEIGHGPPELERSAAETFHAVALAARRRLERDRRIRRNLPGAGRLYCDRNLPYLCLYRPPAAEVDAGTRSLVTGTSAYLIVPEDDRYDAGLNHLLRVLSSVALDRLGGYLLLNIVASPLKAAGSGAGPDRTGRDAVDDVIDALRTSLAGIDPGGLEGGNVQLDGDWHVRVTRGTGPTGTIALDVALAPIYRNPSTGRPYPRMLTRMRRAFVRAIEQAVFSFAQEHTSFDPPHFHALGRREIGRSARAFDRRLGDIATSFDPILLATPVNGEECWAELGRSGFDTTPSFMYRPLPFDPEHLKRSLFSVPLERVEDPLLETLLREKQEELDQQVTMLCDLNRPDFLYGSLQVYGRPSASLLTSARAVLAALPAGASSDDGDPEGADGDGREGGRTLDARGFAAAALAEIATYRSADADFVADARIRDDVSGLIVSGATLCISRAYRVSQTRVPALLHHEVGTHLVTRHNGMVQPIRLFGTGLAGYDALQEGLAVLAEYLVGGLTAARARVLAARALAADAVADGAAFLDTFRMLVGQHGFGHREAYNIAMRAHRGGGHTKDHHYLRGLVELLRYLANDRPLDTLFIGKIALSHIDVVQELVLRGILRPPALKPRYASEPGAAERLVACRRMDVIALLSRDAGARDDAGRGLLEEVTG